MQRLHPDALFCDYIPDADLGRKSVKGGMVTIGSQGIQFLVRIAGTMALARMLTPVDYGIYGMVMVVVGFAVLFKDAGLGIATVQKRHISRDQISNLFWLNLAISGMLGAGIFAIAPLVALFYGRPELAPLTAVLSVTLVLGGLTIQHEALLRRHMQFYTIAIVQISAQLFSLFVTVLLAWFGWRYWALASGAIVAAIVTVGCTFYYCPWVPGPMKRGAGIREMLKFGGYLTGYKFVYFFSRNTDKLVIGKFIGAEALGLYAKAHSLLQVPFVQIRGPISQVALPVLSSLQGQPERYVKYYRRLLDIMVSLMIPLSLYCAIEAEFIIRVMLGSQWMGIVPVFRVLVMVAIMQTVTGTTSMVQLSCGHSGRYFYWGIVTVCFYVASFLVGLPFGIKGVALAYTIVNAVLFFPTLLYCFHKSSVTTTLVIRTIALPLIISAGSAGAATLAQYIFNNHALFGHVITFLVFWGIILISFYCRTSVRETVYLLMQGQLKS